MFGFKKINRLVVLSSLLLGSVAIDLNISLIAFASPTKMMVSRKVGVICRQLREGDKWYPAWRSCCDLRNDRSRWTNSNGISSDWSGSCSYWGINSSPKKQIQICRQLQQGDKWYPGWHSCCDLGNDRSRWTNSNGVASDWGGSCSYWGIR